MINICRRQVSDETVSRILSDLRYKLIVVEGIRDEDALKRLGMGHIARLNRKPVSQFAEEIADKCGRNGVPDEIVILTDFDRKGKRLAALLRRHLERHRKHANSMMRKAVMDLGIIHIEDITSAGTAGLTGGRYVCQSLHQHQ